MRAHRLTPRLLVASWLALALWLALGAEPAVTAPSADDRSSSQSEPTVAPLYDPSRLKGAMSCSGAACHGSLTPSPGSDEPDGTTIRRDEFVIWADDDPHARAFDVLSNERSRRMIDWLIAHYEGPENAEAHERVYARCLACHSLDTRLDTVVGRARDEWPPEARASELARDGAGCEACHGPSRDWYVAHYQPDWAKTTVAQKEALGLRNTEHLLTRARICVECHVGSPERDVDHDLIAAGHPVLKFEFAGYHDLMPPHWNAAAERSRASDYDLRLWAAGQIASAEATLRLLAARAERAAAGHPVAVWPEFSEYDCYACHHDLSPADWRQGRGFAVSGEAGWSTRVGRDSKVVLPWGSWYFALLKAAAERADAGEAERRCASAIDGLQAAMQQSWSPEAGTIAGKARAALEALERASAESPLYRWADVDLSQPQNGAAASRIDRGELKALLAPLVADGGARAVVNWDVATQVYLALAAAGSLSDNDSGAILDALALPERYGSPKTFVGGGARDAARDGLVRALESLDSRPPE